MQQMHRVGYAVPKCVKPILDGPDIKQNVGFLKGCLVISIFKFTFEVRGPEFVFFLLFFFCLAAADIRFYNLRI